MSNLIDLMYLGRDRVIGAYELDGLIVDPGPSSCLEALLEGLEGEPRAILLTHVHLDHAGATGSLVRRFPKLRVYVHEVGAPHLVDPAKLLRSAGRLYGRRHGAPLGRGAPGAGLQRRRARRRRADRGLSGRLHPGPREPPCRLPPRIERRCFRRRRRRGAHTAASVHGRADAAAGHRPGGVGVLPGGGRRLEPATTLPDSLRPRRRRGAAARAPARRAARQRRSRS